jgi:hypothetical protein
LYSCSVIQLFCNIVVPLYRSIVVLCSVGTVVILVLQVSHQETDHGYRTVTWVLRSVEFSCRTGSRSSQLSVLFTQHQVYWLLCLVFCLYDWKVWLGGVYVVRSVSSKECFKLVWAVSQEFGQSVRSVGYQSGV